MNFGKWDSTIHNDSEQLKRIATAKKADTTPTAVNRENNTAEFKGSGKNPYITTLDSCTCGDFFRRKLPCKHIYRLALELEGSEVEEGVNKNELTYVELPCDIFALPAESQEMLYNMCVGNIYHDKRVFFFERNEFSELLFYKGFCVQDVPTAEFMSEFPVAEIKVILFSLGIEGLPKRTSKKTTFVAWIDEHFESIAALVNERCIFLEFGEHFEKLKHTIHRRYTKKFEHIINKYGKEYGYFESVTKIFTQE